MLGSLRLILVTSEWVKSMHVRDGLIIARRFVKVIAEELGIS
jgi:hypothetical protein